MDPRDELNEYDRDSLARFGRLQERRSVADYRATEDVTGDQAMRLVTDAGAFLRAARDLVEKLP